MTSLKYETQVLMKIECFPVSDIPYGLPENPLSSRRMGMNGESCPYALNCAVGPLLISGPRSLLRASLQWRPASRT